jgi:hypothetical protein
MSSEESKPRPLVCSKCGHEEKFHNMPICSARTNQGLFCYCPKFECGAGAGQEVSPREEALQAATVIAQISHYANEEEWIHKVAKVVESALVKAGAEVEVRELREAFKLAKIRLEICRGRFRACHEDTEGGSHPVSLVELDGWIEEMGGVLARERR